MRIMTDTNVIISAILFPRSKLTKVFQKVTEDYTLVLCSHIIEELQELFRRKFRDKSHLLDKFLSKLAFELVYTPADINSADYPYNRDKGDLPILVSALLSDVDIIITGDKDFFEVEIDKPEIISPGEYLEKY
ncbi:MAG: putative toxin-antitoxin system toxin component, PIN family [Peptococcaceae bacterium]|nr:putative toxin-antitoxin system toxin component, PIN family [Peptococcaceae bacterium]